MELTTSEKEIILLRRQKEEADLKIAALEKQSNNNKLIEKEKEKMRIFKLNIIKEHDDLVVAISKIPKKKQTDCILTTYEEKGSFIVNDFNRETRKYEVIWESELKYEKPIIKYRGYKIVSLGKSYIKCTNMYDSKSYKSLGTLLKNIDTYIDKQERERKNKEILEHTKHIAVPYWKKILPSAEVTYEIIYEKTYSPRRQCTINDYSKPLVQVKCILKNGITYYITADNQSNTTKWRRQRVIFPTPSVPKEDNAENLALILDKMFS